MSTSESKLYKEEKVVGKGIGCIAMKEIKKGSLVLREAPQLLYPDVGIRTFEESFRHIEVVIKTFLDMSKEGQESYFNLHNKFDDDKTTWSDGMKQHSKNLVHFINQMTFKYPPTFPKRPPSK